MRRCVIDIESSGLISDMVDYSSFPYKLKETAKLWCVVITDKDTGEVFTAKKEEITVDWLKSTLLPFDFIIAHNGHKFDLIALKLFGLLDYTIGYLDTPDTLYGREVRFIDTIILSRITNPDRFGGHGLEAWGKRLGNAKTDFRAECIKLGIIEKSSPKGSEFLQWCDLMLDYCIQDTKVNIDVYNELIKELKDYDVWKLALKQEHKLADLAVRRENLGFWFDKDLAMRCMDDLNQKMQDLTDAVNPHLPERKLTKTEENLYTPPKNQFKANGEPTVAMLNFTERLGAVLEDGLFHYAGVVYNTPLEEPLKTSAQATIDNLDAVKMHLIDLGWNPSEWRERDLTKDSKKQNLSIEQRVKAFDRWYKETLEGKYKQKRLEILGANEKDLYSKIRKKLNDNKPVKVPTSPSVRVGVEKELCPNLIELGEKVAFAKDFSDYLTYRHRRSSIAGGDVEDMDFNEETPNTGYLAMYREQDGRIPTPAIEIGANTHRYRHIGVANIPRASSIYGKEMRSMFGCGDGFLQLGFDFASLEARIEGHYVYNGTDGIDYADSLIAEKPNDVHSVNAKKLDISRTDAKSFKYSLTYGAQVAKVMKMFALPKNEAEILFDNFWRAVPSLKELKDSMEREWIANNKQFIRGIDGRKINIRSSHSIVNALFQSAGVICAKYVTILMMQELESKGYCIDPFIGRPDVSYMVEYHDESQMIVNPKLIKFERFKTEEESNEFVRNWKGEQLSAISNGNVWYVALPNDISKSINNAIVKTGEMMGLNVPLGFEWIVNKNWYGCH